MTAQEIAALFEELELRLIASLRRNLASHKRQEVREGGQNGIPLNWSAWQAEKLRALSRFRRENKTIAAEYADRIDAETRAMLEEQFRETDGSEAALFGVNGRRLDALIHETTHNEAAVQKAALRYMDDVYRKTILRTAAALAAGGVTLQQAADMATQDFLAQGISCIQYRNGRRVNVAAYAEMALRTNGTRAMLLGEAQLRERMGIDTVLVSQYGGCSKTCLPWQGLVYIDDVWQPYRGADKSFGGTYGYSRNGKSYPLLSVAVRAGLFHPNCRHHLTTWLEGVSERPAPMDKARVESTAALEARQRELERRIRKYKRRAEGTLEPEKAAEYRRKVREAQKDVRAFVDAHGDVLRRDYWRERDTGVENTPKHAILKDNEEENRTVTMQSIANVRVFDCKTLDTAGKQSLQIAHKKLLLEISKQPVGTEMARAFGPDMRPLTDTVAGAPGAESVKMPDFTEPYVLIHNHPDCLTFSPGDIMQFIKRPNLKLLTAVGNDGTVYCMEKTSAFNASALLAAQDAMNAEMEGLSTAEEIVACINAFLKGAGSYGLFYTVDGATNP